ncbi:methyl-accepting chemotaxis sensory transducer with Cache sensor [Arsukibacterium tuosuense]|uniref:Methyl-accepting chemotaxis sensory transducer with Cache sensor n=1 Tax=Arsukibacterium tuosuense TaxID=1323745 RepID=A0A285J890_9GAMM|nr:methyl-accepting chemotaxis protein [Arsukibacterium tuosuense]SNY55331.1 methyl-accepting chemotaxis sensory transducer with Cache sensor [Arsukibacterium tuosuense]
MASSWKSLSLGVRLTVSMVGLILLSIVVLTSLVFVEYKNARTEAVLSNLQNNGSANAEAFTNWLLVRQEEMRYLAALPQVQQADLALSSSLMQAMAQSQGYYDTIFVVGPDGRGQAGVSYANGQARVLSSAEAQDFNVADRAWFKQAIAGQDTFSQPIVSRATGARVSTVAIPIRQNGQVVGVMRGAVQLSTIFDMVNELSRDSYTEIYLLDSDGAAITEAGSLQGVSGQLNTVAADAVRAKQSGVGQYQNAADTAVFGSYNFIPMLGWSLVLESRQADALTDVKTMFWTLFVISLAVLIIAALVCIMLVRSVTKLLGGEPEYAAAAVHQVAEGDLTARIILRPGDSTSLLASISSMQQNLRKMIGQVGDYSDQVASASTELAKINEHTRSGIEQQNSEINNSAVAMNQMTSSLEEVSRNTQQAAQAATAAESETAHGQQIVSTTLTDLNKLSAEVSKASEIINLLKQDSDHIGSILQVIESIAEQTNLLALNAAIEAARAGESGRGFAVVADEVRTLASRTKDSTTEIKQMIEKLQTGTERAVKANQSSELSAKATADSASSAGQALFAISEAVELISSTAHQIASATEQQTTVSRDINQNIHRISDVAVQNSENVVQSARASDALSELAEQLQELVRRFRL